MQAAVKTIRLDIAKSVFQVYGVDADGEVIRRKGWRPARPRIKPELRNGTTALVRDRLFQP